MLNESIISYLDRAASRSPAPGGGSVAALSGALGASMASMVANFTVGKKGYEDVQEEIKSILAESETCRRKLAGLAAEDIRAYEKVSEAFSLPRETREQKELRKQKMDSATREAVLVPLQTIEYSHRLMRTLSRLADTGNKNLISDVGVAAFLSGAAVASARLNVEINLACLDDAKFIEEKRGLVESSLSENGRIMEEVTAKVNGAILKG